MLLITTSEHAQPTVGKGDSIKKENSRKKSHTAVVQDALNVCGRYLTWSTHKFP